MPAGGSPAPLLAALLDEGLHEVLGVGLEDVVDLVEDRVDVVVESLLALRDIGLGRDLGDLLGLARLARLLLLLGHAFTLAVHGWARPGSAQCRWGRSARTPRPRALTGASAPGTAPRRCRSGRSARRRAPWTRGAGRWWAPAAGTRARAGRRSPSPTRRPPPSRRTSPDSVRGSRHACRRAGDASPARRCRR